MSATDDGQQCHAGVSRKMFFQRNMIEETTAALGVREAGDVQRQKRMASRQGMWQFRCRRSCIWFLTPASGSCGSFAESALGCGAFCHHAGHNQCMDKGSLVLFVETQWCEARNAQTWKLAHSELNERLRDEVVRRCSMSGQHE